VVIDCPSRERRSSLWRALGGFSFSDGIPGGHQENTNCYLFKRNTDVLQRFARHRPRADIDEGQGKRNCCSSA